MNSSDCLNHSFLTPRPPPGPQRAASEGAQTLLQHKRDPSFLHDESAGLSELDAKTLLLGDFAENGMWWTGSRAHRDHAPKETRKDESASCTNAVSSRTPRINWLEVGDWYHTILHAGESWRETWDKLPNDSVMTAQETSDLLHAIGQEVADGRLHLQKTFLKATENLLKRPRQPLKHARDSRFLLILMSNPLLSNPTSMKTASLPSGTRVRSGSGHRKLPPNGPSSSPSRQQGPPSAQPYGKDKNGPGHHSGILKRILGLLSNMHEDCHRYFVSWFSRLSDQQFQKLVDVVGGFVTYRLTRAAGRKDNGHGRSAELIPAVPLPATGTSAQLHAALGMSGSSKQENKAAKLAYTEDWQLKAAARVMALLFTANNIASRRRDPSTSTDPVMDAKSKMMPSTFAEFAYSAGLVAKQHAYSHGQMIPISSFYNTMLDYLDLIADFEAWESKRAKFTFCQYPFFLSIGAKIRLMEHDARRQMEVKAREAFFDSILSRKAVSQFLVLKVRRDCLVEDSLRGVSEVVGTGQEEIKKGLRIEFSGEEGIDAGGLRKEWFLLLTREVFDPAHGMSNAIKWSFYDHLSTLCLINDVYKTHEANLIPGLFLYDEDSQYCYFNPNCFESSEQFFLVGVVLGLAIYNSTILDVALPPFAFKKLLASAPASTGPSTATPRVQTNYTLEDLAQYRPALAKGLKSLLEYDGNVEETFCRDFVAEVDRYGQKMEVPLCPDGQNRPVTNSNRKEFVDLYIQYLLDTSVARQYEPLKRGFFTVCGGNALGLFRPEEIELLVRGSDEPLDIASVQAVAIYDGWDKKHFPEPVIGWFWDYFQRASPKDQRKMLSFITGSDRIPAMGATNLVIKVLCLGDDSERFPIARTCFNAIGLFRYASRAKLEQKLARAVGDSEGFGLK